MDPELATQIANDWLQANPNSSVADVHTMLYLAQLANPIYFNRNSVPLAQMVERQHVEHRLALAISSIIGMVNSLQRGQSGPGVRHLSTPNTSTCCLLARGRFCHN
jgi:hypothetical protein